jgi:hypothetical protein
MKQTILLAGLLLCAGTLVHAQIYKGPAAGSISSGATVSTDNFLPGAPTSYPGPLAEAPRNKFSVPLLPNAPGDIATAAAPASRQNVDRPFGTQSPTEIPPVTLGSFEGIPDQGNLIPPDPYLAVGPNHVIAVVNSRFRIYDKGGNILKTIDARSWFSNVFANNSCFDPKVIYDQISGRWVMVWLQQRDSDSTGTFLISVSDDDNPLGTWYNWASPATWIGSAPDLLAGKSWADYQGVGYDKDALYISSNQFGFDGNYKYVRIRIIPKTDLYANTAGSLSWQDLWDIRNPGGLQVFTVRPARIHGSPKEYYLIADSRSTTSSYFTLYRLTNPLTTPSLRAYNVPVAAHTSPPLANQLGGSTILIESGGRNIRNEPVYMDSSLWVVHSVASGTGNAYSSVRYVRINLVDSSAAEDGLLGADGYWYFYPALAVDKDKNVVLTYSRSGTTEYIGAYATWHYSEDLPSVLAPSHPIKPGKANYVKDFGSGRNRWGDYNGAWIDPSDPSDFWLFTEYAESPVNTWATWLYHMRLVPYAGPKVYAAVRSVNFGLHETGLRSDTVFFTINNYGDTPLNVTNISTSLPQFALVNVPSLPVQIATFDSITIGVHFAPTDHGVQQDTIVISSNDPGTPLAKVALQGKGIKIGRADISVMYGTTGSPTSQLYTVNTATGTATAVGPLGISEIDGLTVRPSSQEIYGVTLGTSSSELYRLSAGHGDALHLSTMPLGNVRALAFSPDDTLFVATTAGKVYRVNPGTGDTSYVGPSGINVSSLCFRPGSGQLWASVRPGVVNKDKIYTIDRGTGASTVVGSTGLNVITPHIAFGPAGNLYAIIGSTTQTSNLYALDTLNAKGTIIGSTGVQGMLAITMRTDSLLTGVRGRDAEEVPRTFVLEQNYPNPFNPSTEIRFGLPQQSDVTLTVFNIVGQIVATPVQGVRGAGYHNVVWDGTGESGSRVASGVYFYRLEARPVDGGSAQGFTQIRKMVLLK